MYSLRVLPGMYIRRDFGWFKGAHQACEGAPWGRPAEGQRGAYSALRPPVLRRSRIPQTFNQVAAISKHLKHPNIVPLLGAATEPLELISEWMPGGELLGYLARRPDADRLSLVCFLSTRCPTR